MTSIELFLLVGAGYVCGLSIYSGFAMRWILVRFIKDGPAWTLLAWSAWMLVNTLTAAVIPVLLIAVLVIGDQPGRPDFWPRLALFATGLLTGMTFVLGSMYVFDRTSMVVKKPR